MVDILDHTGNPVKHGRARINGIRMHYVSAGQGEPLLLLHGTPKTSYYWAKLMPLLTKHFTVVAPDLRGFGYTDKPPAEQGYDSLTNASDMAELMTQLGHDRFHLHGEDRGAEFGYVLAATQRDRVLTLSFCEMMLSGLGLEEFSHFTPENISAQYRQQGVWNWHLPFFWIPHIPEMLITGREREFWEYWIRAETWNPTAIDDAAISEWVARLAAPGGLRGCLETYRAGLKNAEINRRLSTEKLTLPVMTIGAPEFFGPFVEQQMRKVAERVERSEVFAECGHSLAWEAEAQLALALREFMLAKR
ncbi:alpha/beta fold hydrolase (plasmid) [Agrobacterium salinitolerans]|uniref:Alpha/beta fold hydrolase n=1 Tax=Agrobacterium salinitolerans TaxID=1183413 RepID=A0A4Z1QUB4_9HYPH|nr:MULTISPECIES: alpha/beta fold hydrolase [Agrobacterium]MDH6298061.1 pimeloyl-ACP methyl ester carboxylesterase [Agrobacterium fabrum]UYZ10835.1 alpha/beta fold hydrolase [Agrobacterium salinitolerans]